jgi:hypothetical protein
MSGDAQIARRIASMDGDTAVKRCLSTLFTHELSNADKGSNVEYKSFYHKILSSCAAAWQPTGSEVDE